MHFVRLAATLLKDEEFARYFEYDKIQLLLTVVTPLNVIWIFSKLVQTDFNMLTGAISD